MKRSRSASLFAHFSKRSKGWSDFRCVMYPSSCVLDVARWIYHSYTNSYFDADDTHELIPTRREY